MKKMLIATLILLTMSVTGCQNADAENVTTPEPSEIITTIEDVEVEETMEIPNVEKVEYSHEDIYLSVDIPDGWEYEIKTAEDMAREDGLAICAIHFWSAEFPETVFELGYQESFGVCLTGITIEEFTLSNGLEGCRYTEKLDDTFWIAIALSNPANGMSGGTYVVTSYADLEAWNALEPEFEQILNTVWVGSQTEE